MSETITLIVQVTSECNLKCEYCYVRISREWLSRPSANLISRDLEKFVQNCSRGYESVKFDWHGGEPLLAGRDFYQRVLTACQKIEKDGTVRFRHSIQTNGTLLTDDYLRFFAANGITVGVSFDGLPLAHQAMRFGEKRANSEQFIAEAGAQLKRFGLPLCVLCVVNKLNVGYPREIFDFLVSAGSISFSFLPLINFPRAQYAFPEALTNDEWFEFLRMIFELWLRSDRHLKSIDPIYTVVKAMLNGRRPELCSFSSSCLKRMATITPEGDVVHCGSLIHDQFVLGNIFEKPLIEILHNSKTRSLRQARAKAVKEYCGDCEFVAICRGGCREHVFWSTNQYDGQYPYCDARKRFFQYVQQRLRDVFKHNLNRR